jgi:predicted DNA-binding protein (MmcQ/YjbR family)
VSETRRRATPDWPATGPDDPLQKRAYQAALRRVRDFCLDMADTDEKLQRGHIPVITVKGKNFCIFWRADGRPNVCFSAPPGAQDALVRGDPQRYFVPAYMGVRGWVGIRLDFAVDWDELKAIARESYEWARGGASKSRAQKPPANRRS